MKDELNLEGCQSLCVAVVEQAIRDYRKALKVLKKNPKNADATTTVKKCESFFGKCPKEDQRLRVFGECVEDWTDIDGKKIIEKTRESVRNDDRVEKRGRRNAGKSGARKRA